MTKVMKICDCGANTLLYTNLGLTLYSVTDYIHNNTTPPKCAAFTSTPERAHQKPNITVADVSEISASEHEIGRM
jgi:hypothetical protein